MDPDLEHDLRPPRTAWHKNTEVQVVAFRKVPIFITVEFAAVLLFLSVVWHFAALFLNRLVDLVQQGEVVGLLLVEVLVLIAGLFRFLEQDVALY